MSGRSVPVGSILVVLLALVAGACGSGDEPRNSAAQQRSLCERIGTDALKKVLPNFEPDRPGEGEKAACVRLNEGQAGGFLRITIESPTPGTEDDCGNLEKDTSEGATYMSHDQLGSVGEYACGSVFTEGGGVVVTILSRRSTTNVSIVRGVTPGDVTTVRESVVELARTVMLRV